MSKQAKKRPKPVKPVPITCLCVIDNTGRIFPGWCATEPRLVRSWVGSRSAEDRIIRVRIVRIVPVVAKRRKGAK